MIKITTDNKWKEFKYSYEVPEKVLKDFSWVDEVSSTFFKYLGTWYHASDFMIIYSEEGTEMSLWHGCHTESAFSGVLIKISSDGEGYMVGRYFSS